MNRYFKIFAGGFLLLYLSSSVFADKITFYSGEELEGEILTKTASLVKMKVGDVRKVYFLNEVKDIVDDGEPAAQPQPLAEKLPVKKPSPVQWSPELAQESAKAIVLVKSDSPSAKQNISTGFLVDRNGIVVTTFHTIPDARELTVFLPDGRNFPVAGVIDFDVVQNICLLKVDGQDLPVLSVGDSKVLTPGAKFRTIGTADGNDYFLAEGIVTKLQDDALGTRIVEFNSPLGHALSGSPLIDETGRAIGLITAVNLFGENIHIALPINEFKSYIRQGPFRVSFEDLGKKSGMAYQDLLTAREKMYAGNWPEVLTISQKVIDLVPTLAVGHFYKGSAELYLGKLEEAEQSLRAALKWDPNYQAFYLQLGLIQLQQRRYGPAIEEFQNATKLNPASPQPFTLTALAYWDQGLLNEAAAFFKKSLEVDPNNLVGYLNLGLLYQQSGNCKAAIPVLEKYLLFAENPQVLNALGLCQKNQGALELAINYFIQAISLAPKESQLYSNLCAAYQEHGDQDLAHDTCAQAEALTQPAAPAAAKTPSPPNP